MFVIFVYAMYVSNGQVSYAELALVPGRGVRLARWGAPAVQREHAVEHELSVLTYATIPSQRHARALLLRIVLRFNSIAWMR